MYRRTQQQDRGSAYDLSAQNIPHLGRDTQLSVSASVGVDGSSQLTFQGTGELCFAPRQPPCWPIPTVGVKGSSRACFDEGCTLLLDAVHGVAILRLVWSPVCEDSTLRGAPEEGCL